MLKRPLRCALLQRLCTCSLFGRECLPQLLRKSKAAVCESGPSWRPASQADARQGGEDDLDALLAHFQLSDKRQKEVQVLGEAPPPSPRVFATWTAVPTQARALSSLQERAQERAHAQESMF